MDILITDYATERTGSSLEKIHDLHTQLFINIMNIEALTKSIEKISLQTPDDFDSLEELYRKEFMLYMNNSSLSEDLLNYLNNEPRTNENEFELAKIERDVNNMVLSEVINL